MAKFCKALNSTLSGLTLELQKVVRVSPVSVQIEYQLHQPLCVESFYTKLHQKLEHGTTTKVSIIYTQAQMPITSSLKEKKEDAIYFCKTLILW